MTARLEVWAPEGIGEIAAGDDVVEALLATGVRLEDGDVLVVTSKVVSKAEGRLVPGAREEHLDAETVRVVAERGRTRIVQTRHGFVMAAAGIDASNVPAGMVALLPLDPDASASRLRDRVRELAGVEVAVVVTDTAGRTWRNGVVDMAIGAAGLEVLSDLRGLHDAAGHELEATVVAVADELASAADLVKGKLAGRPVAVVRGWTPTRPEDDRGARPLVRIGPDDMFGLGRREAARQAVLDRRDVTAFAAEPVPDDVVRRALAAGSTAPGSGAAAAEWVVVRPTADLAAVLDDPVVAGAPLALVLCAPADGRSSLSLGAVLENVLITLAADGVGSSWRDGADLGAVAGAVPLPAGTEAVAVVAAGVPAGS